jgi:hypothetical protein
MRKKFIHLSEEVSTIICQLYHSGKSIKEISKIVNYDPKTISNTLIKNNIVKRDKSVYRRHQFDKNYFENIDSKDKAYFLGFLISDGCNNLNGAIVLELIQCDLHILNLFQEKIKHTGDIKHYHKISPLQSTSKLIFCSKKASKDLTNLGCIPAKTHHTYFPDIPEEFHSHFIRGVFDGDGCISFAKRQRKKGLEISPVFAICGNFKLMDKIQQILIDQCELNKTKLSKTKSKDIVNINYAGRIQVKRIYNYLYKDCDDLYLTRKKEKFEEIYGNKEELNQFIKEIKRKL